MTQVAMIDAPARAAALPGFLGVGEPGLVHVVDTDANARMLLAHWLKAAGLKASTYAAMDGVSTLTQARAPQCIIVDMQILWSAGFGAASASPSSPRCPIIVTAHRPDIAMAVMAMKTGAADFVEKPLREDQIVAAVSAAIEGDRARIRRDAHNAVLRERFAQLSRREQQVMARVTTGSLNKQVGGALNLSEVTVKAHRGSAMRKMGAETFAELVRMAGVLDEELTPLRNDC